MAISLRSLRLVEMTGRGDSRDDREKGGRDAERGFSRGDMKNKMTRGKRIRKKAIKVTKIIVISKLTSSMRNLALLS
ncbi:MAG: hypothetical protein PHE89_02535 [Alphaproteobacteria bacterium]|nr:hypothetical protein [Alphaproteobacteria bacterium]